MKRVTVAALVLSVTPLMPGPASAGDTLAGRWAQNADGCTFFGGPALVVTGYALRWRDDSCRIVRMYRTGDAVHVQADCWSAQGARSVPVSMRRHGGRLHLRWNRAAAGDLQRCR